jgi:hypothetical protein
MPSFDLSHNIPLQIYAKTPSYISHPTLLSDLRSVDIFQDGTLCHEQLAM